eukprot:1021636-Amphidinium_carterae.2
MKRKYHLVWHNQKVRQKLLAVAVCRKRRSRAKLSNEFASLGLGTSGHTPVAVRGFGEGAASSVRTVPTGPVSYYSMFPMRLDRQPKRARVA